MCDTAELETLQRQREVDRRHPVEVPAVSDEALVHMRAPDETPVYREVHPSVYKIALLGWIWIIAMFWLMFGGEGESAYMVAISTGFFAIYFIASWLLLAMRLDERDPKTRFRIFLTRTMDTWTGPMSGLSVLIQVALIPIALAFAVTAMAVILAVVRAS